MFISLCIHSFLILALLPFHRGEATVSLIGVVCTPSSSSWHIHGWRLRTHAHMHTLRAFAGRQSSICAPALPDILRPLGQRRGVVWPRGIRGVPSRLQALGEPSCAADCRCPPVARICAAFLLFLRRLDSGRWLAKQALACKHPRPVPCYVSHFVTVVRHCYRQVAVMFSNFAVAEENGIGNTCMEN